MDINQLKKQFKSIYGESKDEIRTYFAPGRVNLIGEHVDYNGGYVFPCALSLGTYILARQVQSDTISFTSENYDFRASISRSDWQIKHGNHWINYPLGVVDQFLKKGFSLGGLQLLFYGDLPNGAGLSSSASVEMGTAVLLNDIFSCQLDGVELARMSQKAENQFVGVNCGIMDQFASGMGKKDHAIYLDCSSLKYELVPIKLNGNKLVIANTNKPRKLADSKYNERRSECDKAVEFINKVKSINLLGELSLKDFNELSKVISDNTILRRARHVVSEIERTNEAVHYVMIMKLPGLS